MVPCLSVCFNFVLVTLVTLSEFDIAALTLNIIYVGLLGLLAVVGIPHSSIEFCILLFSHFSPLLACSPCSSVRDAFFLRFRSWSIALYSRAQPARYCLSFVRRAST